MLNLWYEVKVIVMPNQNYFIGYYYIYKIKWNLTYNIDFN